MAVREDVQLTSGCRMVLLFEGGEFYLRLLQRIQEGRHVYLTRKIIVTEEEVRLLAGLKVELRRQPVPVRCKPVSLFSCKETLEVRIEENLAGSTTLSHATGVTARFLEGVRREERAILSRWA